MFSPMDPRWPRQEPRGFTRTPEIRAILEPCEARADRPRLPNGLGGLWHFDGLTAAEAERLLSLLPPSQADDQQNAALSFGQFVELGRHVPKLTFHGYRIGDERGDERITIEGIEVRGLDAFEYETVLEAVKGADELDECREHDGYRVRAWWD